MIRMEIACFIVLAFMAILYFSSKREKTEIHKIFSVFLILAMIHLALDGITIYTVNHLEEVPSIVNDVVHKLFIGTMVILFYLIYRYIAALIKTGAESKLPLSHCSTGVLVLALGGILLLPLEYMITEKGNYSYGPAAYITYISIAVYLAMVVGIVLKHRKQIHPKKRLVITLAMGIEVIVSLYQAMNPLALISGMGIMLIALSFYLLMENPDIRLVNQVKEEKEKADAANASKSIFLSYVSHEIRTPMNAIIGMTDVLLRTKLDEEQKEYLNNIKISGDALVFIINNILDISKIEAGKMELVPVVYNLEEGLKNIRMMMKDRIGEKDVVLSYDIDSEVPPVLYGDGMRIRQVIINLLGNAVKYTDEGHVTLSIKVLSKTEEEVELRIAVSDTGIGIKKEDLSKLFVMFEQLDKKKNAGKEGTGLGLAISNQLIEMMGGKLLVESEYGVGSEFSFVIKQKLISEVDCTTTEKNIPFISPDAKILIVDDDIMNRKVAVKLLEPLKMQVDVADSARQALEMIEDKAYHIVFMDHMMPIMDGAEATKLIRGKQGKYYSDLPIIALTANALTEAEIIFYEAGMNDVLTKPIEVEKLNQMIRKWLPESLVQMLDKSEEKEKTQEKSSFTIEGLDVEEGIKYSGNLELYLSLLGDFYILIDAKTNKIRECLADDLIRDFTIEVHALKNSARLIGAKALSEGFEHLEKLGNEKNKEEILLHIENVLSLYHSYKTILKPYGDRKMIEKKAVPTEEIIECLRAINICIDAFDIETADKAMAELETMKLPKSCDDLMEKLRVFMADVALEDILDVTQEMIAVLKETR